VFGGDFFFLYDAEKENSIKEKSREESGKLTSTNTAEKKKKAPKTGKRK
jgi:hypothetical protein